ncbi:MAG: DoxX family membrane protein [Phycisphaerales bacterium]|nr:DoxX family membrane protein [Phycisphaerales bacterium]
MAQLPLPPNFSERFDRIDRRITSWMARHGLTILRISVGVVFLWFGAIKFVPGLSPADELATRTVAAMTFDLVGPGLSRPGIATLETLIGLGLLTGVWLRAVLLLLAFQMLGTLTPVVLFPDEVWRVFPVALTMEGQYIAKNAVVIAAGIVIGATVRGGQLTAEPTRSPAQATDK